ncbi:MAG: glycerol-3-phosphate acyltransferase [Chloroflexota bacterium]|nr:glycerol-3-phosphate acyltransferase [Chloroflexota bacterium]
MAATYYGGLLAFCAFWLGACPLSVWLGRWCLRRDIREYGDGNPGAANVFRAGGRKLGSAALALDVGKGVPFVAMAHLVFHLPVHAVMVVAVSAVLGHAFSPFLRFRGGKAIAVTFGVMLALPQHEILFLFVLFTLLGFFFLRGNAWTVTLASVGTMASLMVMGGRLWEPLFMLCVAAVFILKHGRELRTLPGVNGRLVGWLQTRKRET